MTEKTTIDVGRYRVEFDRDFVRPPDPSEVVAAPYKGQIVPIPFTISGDPGLIDVRMLATRVHEGPENSLVKGFTATLAPTGLFTAWTRKEASFRGVLEVPTHMFPFRVSVKIANLSESL